MNSSSHDYFMKRFSRKLKRVLRLRKVLNLDKK